MNAILDNCSIGILAGGEGRRVNGADKGLLMVNGRPLIEYGLAALSQQLPAAPVFISANRNLEQYQHYGNVVTDQHLLDQTAQPTTEAPFAGPLVGIAALLEQTTSDYLLIVPCDCPRLPPNLAAELAQSLLNEPAHEIAVVHDGQRQQNAVLLINKSVLGHISRQLRHGQTAIYALLESVNTIAVDFSDWPADYWNANTVEQLEQLTQP